MKLTTLGTSSPYPRPHDPCSSFLLGHDGTRLWIDTGAGSLGALLAHCPLQDLDAVWVSHTHADHFSDLAATFYALRYADVTRPPLPVFGPPGWAERLRAFLSHDPRHPSPLEDVFVVEDLRDRQQVRVGSLELTVLLVLLVLLVHHDAPCYGLRATADGLVVAYTGDTGPCGALTDLAAGADLLVSEAGYGLVGPRDEAVHLTAAQAGAVARDARVGRLVLTHLAGADVQACVEAAAAAGAPAVTGARPGLVLEIN